MMDIDRKHFPNFFLPDTGGYKIIIPPAMYKHAIKQFGGKYAERNYMSNKKIKLTKCNICEPAPICNNCEKKLL